LAPLTDRELSPQVDGSCAVATGSGVCDYVAPSDPGISGTTTRAACEGAAAAGAFTSTAAYAAATPESCAATDAAVAADPMQNYQLCTQPFTAGDAGSCPAGCTHAAAVGITTLVPKTALDGSPGKGLSFTAVAGETLKVVMTNNPPTLDDYRRTELKWQIAEGVPASCAGAGPAAGGCAVNSAGDGCDGAVAALSMGSTSAAVAAVTAIPAACAETASVSVATDLAACSGVSELAVGVACLAILTDSAADNAAAKASTYTAAVAGVDAVSAVPPADVAATTCAFTPARK
jgi:hypothetical protein